MQRGINELSSKKQLQEDKKRELAKRVLGNRRRMGNSDKTRAKREERIAACITLQDDTRGARALASSRFDLQSNLGRLVEAFSDAAILNGRAFCPPVSSNRAMRSIDCGPHTQVLHSANLLGLGQTLIERDRIRVIIHLLVFPQVALERGEHDSHAGAILVDFRNPLGPDVLEGVRAVDLYPDISTESALNSLTVFRHRVPYTKTQHQDVGILVG